MATLRSRAYLERAAAAMAVLLAAAQPQAIAAQDVAATPPDVRLLLQRAETVYRGLGSMQAAFEQTIEVPLLGRRRDGTGTWYQKGPGRFKMDFSDPAGDVIVADGHHLWLYYPSTHPGQVIRSSIDGNTTGAGMIDLQGRIFEEADKRYEAVLNGAEEITGYPAWSITMTPIGESPYRRVRVWVDQSSLLVRRFEILEENETIRTVVLRNLRPNQPIDDSVFDFVPPEGTDVFEG